MRLHSQAMIHTFHSPTYVHSLIVTVIINFFVKRLRAFDKEFDNLINFDLSNEYYLLNFD
jgi:hypothetical protein